MEQDELLRRVVETLENLDLEYLITGRWRRFSTANLVSPMTSTS